MRQASYNVDKMDLPKKYLSYSALSLWERNKVQFRERYYENKKMPDTPEIIFGRQVAELLETTDVSSHPVLSLVPRYPKPEYELKVLVGEVPILGFVDSFDPAGNRFVEYKTGRDHPDGRPRWTQLEVEKTDQLPIYSLLLKEKHGSVDNHTELWWMGTRYKPDTIGFDGHVLSASGDEIEFDGRVKGFKRTIYEWERQKMKEKIIKLAHEIEHDWKTYKRTALDAFQRESQKSLEERTAGPVKGPLSADAGLVGREPQEEKVVHSLTP